MSAHTREAPRLLLENAYATYPHANGYYGDGGRRVALGRAAGVDEIVGVAWDAAAPSGGEPEVLVPAGFLVAASGHERSAWSPEAPTRSVPWFDVGLRSHTLVCAHGDALIAVELSDAVRRPRVAYRSQEGWTLDGLAGVAADGRTAAVTEEREGVHRALLVELGDGSSREILRHRWHANHVHFAPADEGWIGYSHEGPATAVDDRVWAWHSTAAPSGRPVVDQRALSHDPPDAVALGHERWMFHDLGAVVVAYGESPAGPRGVYEVFVDGRPPRLVSAGERDWHVGISRDGRRLVVDTTGPAGAPGRGWEHAGTSSSIVLIDAVTGERRTLVEAGFIAHPYHPHPSFTPDGSAVVFNHVERDSAGAVVRRGVAIVDVDPPGRADRS
ncbi:hypothetical protein [Microbacterium jejuense]|uniref:hypothetical protein n=1 Tax=Microbacterium jejuense TaxID=1263637 RepID=UPI0031EE72F0